MITSKGNDGLYLLFNRWPIDLAVAPLTRTIVLIAIGALTFFFPWLTMPGADRTLIAKFFILIWVATIAVPAGLAASYRLHGRLYFTWPWKLVALWLGVRTIATIFSVLPFHSLWGTYLDWGDGLVLSFVVTLLAYTVYNLRPTKTEIALVSYGLVLQGLLIGLSVLMEYTILGNLRPNGPIGNSDFTLAYGLLIWPMTVAIAYRHYGTQRNRPTPLFWGRQIVLSAIAAILGVALFLSTPIEFQRHVYPWSHLRLGSSSNTSQVFLTDTANSERWNEWRIGLMIFRNHPWFGSGPGTVQAEFYRYVNDVKDWNFSVYATHPHSDTIEQLAETGIIGALSYFAAWVGFGWYAWKRFRLVDNASRVVLVAIGGGVLLNFIFLQFLFATVETNLLRWLLIAIALSCLPPPHQELVTLQRRRWASVAIASILIGGLATSYYGGRYYLAIRSAAGAAAEVSVGHYVAAVTASSRAVRLMPHEDTFTAVASSDAAPLAINPSLSIGLAKTDRPLVTKNRVLDLARRSIDLNPYLPIYWLDLGANEYLFAPPGSPAETAGLAQMEKAIAMTPEDYKLYVRAAEALTVKRHYQDARAMLDKALTLALTPQNETEVQRNVRQLDAVTRQSAT